MTKHKRRVSINAAGKQTQQEAKEDKEAEIRFKIKELRGKIKMKERGQSSEKVKNQKTICENDQAILEMRMENSHLRRTVRKALDMERFLVSETLSDRKRQRLALSGKSSEQAKKELDMTVCDLARKLNDLCHTKKKQLDKIELLEKQMYEKTQSPEADPEISTRARQLENSINKVKLKTATAYRIKGVYSKIRKTVEDALRGYPNMLNDLEKKILEHRTELQSLKNLQKTATTERDTALAAKTNLEAAVREDRRGREITIRAMRNRVKNVTTMIEIPHTRGKPSRYAEDEQRLIELAKRIEERLEKIKEYQQKANMLELVTGIPFVNKEGIVNCFRNQKQSSRSLRAQTIKNRTTLCKNRELLDKYIAEYEKLIHEHEMELENKIRDTQKQLDEQESRKENLLREDAANNDLMEQVHSWLEPITTRLLRPCEHLNMKSAKALIWKARDCVRPGKEKQDIPKLFSIFTELLNTLDEATRDRVKDQNDLEAVPEKEEDVLLGESNNRVLSTLERKVSEDFDYNTPNNDEYISRTAIKRQADSRRGNRYEKL